MIVCCSFEAIVDVRDESKNDDVKSEIQTIKYYSFLHMLRSTTITRESFDMRLVGYIPQIQADGSFRGRIRTNLATIDNKVAFNLTLSKCGAATACSSARFLPFFLFIRIFHSICSRKYRYHPNQR